MTLTPGPSRSSRPPAPSPSLRGRVPPGGGVCVTAAPRRTQPTRALYRDAWAAPPSSSPRVAAPRHAGPRVLLPAQAPPGLLPPRHGWTGGHGDSAVPSAGPGRTCPLEGSGSPGIGVAGRHPPPAPLRPPPCTPSSSRTPPPTPLRLPCVSPPFILHPSILSCTPHSPPKPPPSTSSPFPFHPTPQPHCPPLTPPGLSSLPPEANTRGFLLHSTGIPLCLSFPSEHTTPTLTGDLGTCPSRCHPGLGI